MALFKIFKGSSTALGATSATSAANEGFAYFTPDDGKFYIDIANATTATVGVNRIPLNAYQADLATTSLYANHAASSTWSRYAASAGFTQFASSANWANYSGTANWAKLADTAKFAVSAAQATYSASSGYSTSAAQATYSASAGYTLSSGSAGYATSASRATYSASAGWANYSGTANYGKLAGTATWSLDGRHSSCAGYATSASQATYAASAGYTLSSGSAGYATSAARATYSASAGYSLSSASSGYATSAAQATYAASAGYATSASQATHSASANYSLSAGSAGYATSASQATHAASANYSLSAGSAGYAASAARATYSASANWANYSGTANQAVKVYQTASNSTTADYRILLSTSAVDTAETGSLNKSTNLKYNPSTNKLSTVNIDLTGELNVNGNTNLHNQTTIDNATLGTLLVNGAATFNQIPQSITPADASNDTSVATTAFVYNAFKANDAMIFKGVVNQDSDLPATHYQGWTYRVGTKGYYAGEYCEVGDIIICVTDGTSANALHWARIQNNVDGAVYMGFGANAAADIGSTTQPVYVQSNGKVSAVSYVASAARATYAASSGYAASAARATYSASAGYAQLALTASYAVTALRAISAASAGYSTSAAQATHSASANYALSAGSAGYAASAAQATHSASANYSLSSGSAGYAASAARATYSASSTWANISGSATQAAKVTQNAANTNATAYRVLLSTSGVDTAEVGALNKATNLQYNPSTNTLSTGSLYLAGDIDVIGNAVFENQTTIESLTAEDLIVNTSARINGPLYATASNAITAANALIAASAARAVYAASAGYAASAAQATHSASANYSLSAGSAGYATSAAQATHSASANYSLSAGSAGYATSAAQATHAASANYATTAGHATDNTKVAKAGDTMTGSLVLQHQAGSSKELNIIYSTTIDYWWGVGTANENHGLYDAKTSKWILAASATNAWTLDGKAGSAGYAASAAQATHSASAGYAASAAQATHSASANYSASAAQATHSASANYSASAANATYSASSNYAQWAWLLANKGGTTVSATSSLWAHGKVGAGNAATTAVWFQNWKQSGLTYTASGATAASTLTDSGDMVIWLSKSNTTNALYANMILDGQIYANSGFVGSLAGKASCAGYALSSASAGYSSSAARATYSASAGYAASAAQATHAASANYSLSAGSAGYAASAAQATHAASANYSLSAGSAGYAASAAQATHSASANYSLSAGSAGYAASAAQATHSASAGYSASAAQATHSASANYALSAGSAGYAASAARATYSASANYTTWAWLLANKGGTTVSATSGLWAHGKVGAGNAATTAVWFQQWRQSGLTYTASGATAASSLTDAANMVIWLSKSNTTNALDANMILDGKIYAIGGFEGSLAGQASCAGYAASAAQATHAASANYSASAAQATHAASANYSASAAQATHSASAAYALSAGSAGYAASAAQATHAASANYSASAAQATHAASAAYALSAGSAGYAASAAQATHAASANYAASAAQATHAASANYATSAAMATQAGKLTNLTSADSASATDTWRKVWISYNDNATGRPAITDNLVFQTSTNTLKTVNTTLTGNLDVTGNAYLHNQSYIDNAQIGNLTVTGPATLNNTLSVGDRASLVKCINNLLTGTGTAGRDAGSGASPRYFPALWTFNAGFTPQNGDIFAIKIPVAGHAYGVYLSVNNGANYYPIVCNGTGRLTTHYGVNTQILLMFDSAGSAASMTPKDGAASANGSTISGGVFRVLNYYDANTTYSAMGVAEARGGTATTSRVMRADYLKTFLSTLGGTGLTFTHNNSGIVLNHSNSITAKTAYGSTSTTASANGGTIKVTDVQYDAQGHITASTDRTITLSQNDTKNTAGSTNTTSKIFLIGATSQAANPQTYSHSAVYVTNGTLTAGTFSGSGASLTSLNGSNISSGTVPFARLPSIYWANIAGTSAASYNKAPEMAKIKLNGNTSASSASTKNVELVYYQSSEVLNFVFS